MKIWQIKNDFLVDVGRLRVANIMQFYSQPKLEKIIGDKRTEEYKKTAAKAAMEGRLIQENGEDYIAKYRSIRVKDKALDINPKTGLVQEKPARGFTFFEAKPEFFMPTHGGYDIRYKATSTLPISKPLQQQKDLEMYDRLIQNRTVDPWKLAETILRSMEKDPEEFKYKPPEQQGQPEGKQLEQLVELASVENADMMGGKKIGPTPYSSPVHTEIHITFMKSDDFKKGAPEGSNILQIFTNHVVGELIAQQTRKGQMQGLPGAPEQGMEMQGGQAPMAQAEGGQNIQMAATMPGRAQGGGEMPPGMRGAETGIQVGRKI